MRCRFYMGPAAVLVVIVLQTFLSDVGCSEVVDQQNPQTLSKASALTAQFRAHNAASLLQTLAEEAQQGMRLTPEEARLLLAGSWSAPGPEGSWAEAYLKERDVSSGLQRQGEDPDFSQLYENVTDTLGTAKDVAKQAGRRLRTIFGLGADSTDFLQRWKEGTTAVKGAFGKLFGAVERDNQENTTPKELEDLPASLVQQRWKEGTTAVRGTLGQMLGAVERDNRKNITPKELEDLLASLVLQQQQLAPSTNLDSHAQEKQEREREAMEVVKRLFWKGAPGAPTSKASAEASTGRVGRRSREAGSPPLRGVDSSTSQQVQKMVSMLLPESEEPTSSLLSEIPSVEDLQEHLANIARVVNMGEVGSMGASGLATAVGLASPLSSVLPATSFGPMSILTNDDTLKNWVKMVETLKQYGVADYTSKEAVDLMQRMAVVLACAYKTARTLLGENEANNLIRAAIRQNAAFKEQILSSVKKNLMEGVETGQEMALGEGARGSEGSLPTEARSRADIESRLLRELLIKLTHMSPSFYSNLIQNYRETLDQWGVKPHELLSIVREALALSLPPKEKGDGSYATSRPGLSG